MIEPASSERPAEEVEEVVDGSLVLEGEAMVGADHEKAEDGETGEQVEVRRAKASVAPKLPSQKDVELHNVGGHLTYRSWCPFCVAGRKPNNPHRRQWD